ncbi:hypothetical protein Saa2_00826 [Streptomyces acidiscabies]|nr:hypothetical protein Saa2_00826 [Streptomyces acidiscabies]
MIADERTHLVRAGADRGHVTPALQLPERITTNGNNPRRVLERQHPRNTGSCYLTL